MESKHVDQNIFIVELQDDHLKRITQSLPIQAVAELIWNGFDADASEVSVKIERSQLRIESIVIEDNGLGMPYSQARQIFAKLGDSWKANGAKTKSGRVIHGKEGQGRFKAFSLGHHVTWNIRYERESKIYEYAIHSNIDSIKKFQISPETESTHKKPGVTVEIADIFKNFRTLDDGNEKERIAPIFAVYLSNYGSAKLKLPSGYINISELIKRTETTILSDVIWKERSYSASIKICEWHAIEETGLWLCTNDGFPIQKYSKQIRGLGDLQYTAYLCSELIEEIKKDGFIELDLMNAELSDLIAQSIQKIKDYAKTIKGEQRKNLVRKWREEAVYPFEGDPISDIEEAEREIFDIVAIGLSENVKKFEDSDAQVKSLQMKLLKHAVSKGPAELNYVLNEVLDLPKQKLEELRELLQETTLSAIISMGKTVSHRLKFLTALEEIVFDEELTKIIKERSQLHKILEDNVWIFGETYSLSASDRSLTNVLRAAAAKIERELVIDEPVKRIDGRDGIVDLMISRSFPTTSDTERHFLVIELKAPKVIAGRKERDQIVDYAQAVVNDLRFKGLNCTWEFILIAKESDQIFSQEIKGSRLGNGAFQYWNEHSTTVRFLAWGQIIGENRARLNMLSKMLEYSNDREEALAHLKTKYKKYTENIVLAEDHTESPVGEAEVPKAELIAEA